MKIVTYSPRRWDVADTQLELGQHQLVRLVGELGGMVRQLSSQKPDIVFLEGFELTDSLYIQAVEKLCLALPDATIVAVHPQQDPELHLALMRAGVRDVVVESSPETLRQVIERAQIRTRSTAKGIGRVLGFMSAKGGDGSTSITASLAYALAQEPDTRVLAIDASLPFGDLDMFLTGSNHTIDLADISAETDRLDKSLLDSMVEHLSPTFDLISSPATFEKIVTIDPDHVSELMHIAANLYDYVIVDIGSCVDQVGIGVLEHLDELYIVASPSLPSLRRAGQLLKLLDAFEKPMEHTDIILNRADSTLPVSIARIEKLIGRKITRRLPADNDSLQESLLIGQPLIAVAPKSRLSKTIVDWAAQLTGSNQPKPSSLWQRLKIK